nr:unnamed protein product [Digitaria exilis]
MKGHLSGQREWDYRVGSLQERSLEELPGGGGGELPPHPLQAALHLAHHLRSQQTEQGKSQAAPVRSRLKIVSSKSKKFHSVGRKLEEDSVSPCCYRWTPWLPEQRKKEERTNDRDLDETTDSFFLHKYGRRADRIRVQLITDATHNESYVLVLEKIEEEAIMAAGDEWIHVPSCHQEEVKEAAETETAAEVTAAAGKDKPSESMSDGGADADEESNNKDGGGTDDAAAAATDSDGDEDGGSYVSTEVTDYLHYFEEEDELAEDDVAAAEESLCGLNVGEGKEVVVDNPFYDYYGGGGQHTDAEAYHGYYGYYGYRSASGSAFGGYVPGSGLASASHGYGCGYGYGYGYGSSSTSRGYDDRYGYASDAYGYNRYGDAYGSGPAYGYGDAYVYCYGGGYGGYYGGLSYEPRYPWSVVYRGPPAYGLIPLYPAPMHCHYAGAGRWS